MYQFDKAVADFDRAIELAPKSVWSLTNRGVTYLQMGHKQKGNDDILQACRPRPDVCRGNLSGEL